MIQSPEHLGRLLNLSKQKLLRLVKETDNYYYNKKKIKTDPFKNPVLNEAGEPVYRILRPSKGLLKATQSKIKGRIFDKHPLPTEVYGGVAGKDNVLNALYHKGNKYFFVTDLRKFYPSISYKRVYQLLIDLTYSHDVARILTRLTTEGGCLPQGTPTSTSIANLVFRDTDIEISKFCKSTNLRYTRFVDDLTFSSTRDFREHTGKLAAIIAKSGFRIARDKTGYKIGPAKVTGVAVRNNYLDTFKEFDDTIVIELSDSSFAGKINYKRRVEAIGKSNRQKRLDL